MNTPENSPKELSPAELEAVLQQARDEGWSSLSLVSPEAAKSVEVLRELPPDRLFVVRDLSEQAVLGLAELTKLSSLGLVHLRIGAEKARALASLSGLTSLNLGSNQIGDEGARALLEAWVDRPTAKNLTTLSLRENGDLSSLLPSEVLNTSDAQAILAAYRRFRKDAEEETLQPLNEAKGSPQIKVYFWRPGARGAMV